MIDDYIIKKSTGPLSAGTRVKLISIETQGYGFVKLFARPETGSDFAKLCKKFGMDDQYRFNMKMQDLVQLRPLRQGKRGFWGVPSTD